MHGRPLSEVEATNQVLPRPKTWVECHDILSSSIAVFQFLNQNPVVTAFTNARDRISAFLGNPAQFIEINDAPAGQTFAGLWSQWLDAWITKRQGDVNLWRKELKATCQPFSVADPCWQAGYGNLFETNYPEEDFTFPAAWLSD